MVVGPYSPPSQKSAQPGTGSLDSSPRAQTDPLPGPLPLSCSYPRSGHAPGELDSWTVLDFEISLQGPWTGQPPLALRTPHATLAARPLGGRTWTTPQHYQFGPCNDKDLPPGLSPLSTPPAAPHPRPQAFVGDWILHFPFQVGGGEWGVGDRPC